MDREDDGSTAGEPLAIVADSPPIADHGPVEPVVTVPLGSHRGILFGIVAIGLFMSTVDLTIVATALPAIHKSLHATVNWTGWTITIYGLGTVAVSPIAGKLSDQYGRRRILVSGLVIFTVSSLMCGFANDIYTLIVFRAVQAIGGGTLPPSAAGIVADHFGKDRDRAIGMFGTVASSGQVTGPILGGLLVGYLSWRWIFFVNIPLGVVMLGLIMKFMPESPRRNRTQKTDLLGVLLTVLLVLCAIFGIAMLGNGNTAIDAPIFLVPEGAALVFLVVFLRHMTRHPAPFIPMRLLRAKGFAAVNSISFLLGVAGFGVTSLIPLYAEQRYHLPALSAGSLLSARAIAMVVIGGAAAFGLRRTGYRKPMAGGFALMVLGTLSMSIGPRWGIGPYLWLSLCLGVIGFGLGGANPALSNASLHLAPDDVATITALRSTFAYLGVIFAVAITTAILNRSADPGIAQAHVLWVVGGIIAFVMIPLALRVPEHKGSW